MARGSLWWGPSRPAQQVAYTLRWPMAFAWTFFLTTPLTMSAGDSSGRVLRDRISSLLRGGSGLKPATSQSPATHPATRRNASWRRTKFCALRTVPNTGEPGFRHEVSCTLDFNSYDRYGNMTCVQNSNTNGPCGQWSFGSTTNRVTNSGFVYDAAGDLTEDSSNATAHTYQWDAEGRVSKVDSGSTWGVHLRRRGRPGAVGEFERGLPAPFRPGRELARGCGELQPGLAWAAGRWWCT